VKAKVNG
jgi:hypothetical protein